MARVRVDSELVAEAKRLGGHKTGTEAATAALQEYLRKRKQLRILDWFGKVDYDPNYDYKATRQLDGQVALVDKRR